MTYNDTRDYNDTRVHRTIVSAYEAIADGVSAAAMITVAEAQRLAGNIAMAARARRVADEIASMTGVSFDCKRTRREAFGGQPRDRPRHEPVRPGPAPRQKARNYGSPRNRRAA